MKGRLTGGGREKRTDFPFNFHIVTFGEREQKNVRLGRDFNSLAPFSEIQTLYKVYNFAVIFDGLINKYYHTLSSEFSIVVLHKCPIIGE